MDVLRSIIVVILLVFVSQSWSSKEFTERKKCTLNDTRTIYPNCMQGSNLVLWCDYSNYTKVPDPDTIYSTRSCNNSVALFINDSCLQDLTKDVLGKYVDIEVLDCGSNRMTRITDGVFQANTKLRKIDFCRNYIQYIERGAFKGLQNLEVLNLGNNLLTEIDGRLFEDLESLKELSFHNNLIKSLKNDTFVGLQTLEILILSGNEIESVDESTFFGLTNLKRLQLDGNRIKFLSQNTLTVLPNLEEFTISFNRLMTWPQLGEGNATNMVTLNFAHNQLQNVEDFYFSKFPKLQNIRLEHNNMSRLQEGLFKENPHLRTLDVSNNVLVEIGKYVFFNSCHLEVLNLSNNRLEKIYPEWFTGVIQNGSEESDIGGNVWKCDCDSERFENLMRSKLELQKTLNFTCLALDENKTEEECEAENDTRYHTKCDTIHPLKKQRKTLLYNPARTKKQDILIVTGHENEQSDDSAFDILIFVTVMLTVAFVAIISFVSFLLVTRRTALRIGRCREKSKHPYPGDTDVDEKCVQKKEPTPIILHEDSDDSKRVLV